VDFLYYLLSFFIVINLIVVSHELGHYWAARKVGVKITRFSVGIGPEIFGFDDKNGTRWCFSAFPVGGYVMMLGDADISSSTESEESIKDLNEDEKKASIVCRNNWEKMWIAFAGPLSNYVYSFVVLLVMGMFYGVPKHLPVVGHVLENSPAAAAGFLAGDRILSLDGEKVNKFRDVLVLISNSDNEKFRFEIDRAGERLSIDVKPRIVEKDRPLGGKKKTMLLGLQSGDPGFERLSLLGAVANAFQECVSTTLEMVRMLSRLFSGKKSLDDFGGVVHMASVAGGMCANGNFAMLIIFTTMLSLNLGFINLFPLPVLDGGRILFYFFEEITGRKLNEKVMEYIVTACALLLIVLMLATTVNDVLKIEFVSKFISGIIG
jgi:regulator of sigma E protease